MSQPTVPWEVESARLSIFFSNVIDVEKVFAWKEIVGYDPETSNFQHKNRIKQEFGDYKKGFLTTTVGPNRIDIQIQISNNSKTGLITLGKFPEVTADFLNDVKSYLAKQNEVNRLALGFVLIHSVKDRLTGYKELVELLPGVKLDPDNSSDFYYMINRPKPSTVVSNLKVNRLSKWMVRILALGVLGTNEVTSAQLGSVVATDYSTFLELDVNTSADHKESLPKDLIPKILDELMGFAVGISEKGDFV